MSRRFGRNQRRKLQAKVAFLERNLLRSQGHYQQAVKNGATNAEIIQETANLLGQHFCTLPAESVEVTSMGPYLEGYMMDRSITHSQNFMLEVLPVLRGSAVIDDLSGMMHVRIEIDGHVAGYAISPKALAEMRYVSAARKLNKQISSILTHHIMRSIQKEYGIRP